MGLTDPLYRFLSRYDKYGYCNRCGVSWKYKDHMEPIEYEPNCASFPLCKECYEAVDANQASEFFRQSREEYGIRETTEKQVWTFRYNVMVDKE